MVFLWVKTLKDAIVGDKKGEDARALMYLTGVHMAMAGGAGLPIAAPLGVMMWAVSKFDGDDDRDKDYIEMFKNGMRDTLGDKATDGLTKGIPAMLGMDLSQRIGAGNILSPVFRAPQGKTGQEFMGSVALQLFGAPAGMMANWVDAAIVSSDNPLMAAQKMMPAGFKNLTEAVSRETYGMRDRRGNAVLKDENFDWVDLLAKGTGFAESTQVSNYYDTRNAVNKDTRARENNRGDLMREMVRARVEGDAEAQAKFAAKIEEYNSRQTNKDARISSADLMSQRRALLKKDARTVDGIETKKNNRDIVGEYVSAR